MRRPRGLDVFCVKRTWRPGLASEQTREIGLPGSRELHSKHSTSGPAPKAPARPKAALPVAAAAEGRSTAASEQTRRAAGAEGARAAEGRVPPPPPPSDVSPKKLLGTLSGVFSPL